MDPYDWLDKLYSICIAGSLVGMALTLVHILETNLIRVS